MHARCSSVRVCKVAHVLHVRALGALDLVVSAAGARGTRTAIQCVIGVNQTEWRQPGTYQLGALVGETAEVGVPVGEGEGEAAATTGGAGAAAAALPSDGLRENRPHISTG